jgi:hypothetical protein
MGAGQLLYETNDDSLIKLQYDITSTQGIFLDLNIAFKTITTVLFGDSSFVFLLSDKTAGIFGHRLTQIKRIFYYAVFFPALW